MHSISKRNRRAIEGKWVPILCTGVYHVGVSKVRISQKIFQCIMIADKYISLASSHVNYYEVFRLPGDAIFDWPMSDVKSITKWFREANPCQTSWPSSPSRLGSFVPSTRLQ